MGLVQQLSTGTGQYVDNFSVATTVHMPANIGAGHTVLLPVGVFTNGHNVAITASAGGTTATPRAQTTNSTFMLQVLEAFNVAGGSDAVVVTPGSGGTGYYVGVGAAEFDNLDPAGAYDSGAGVTVTGSGTSASATVTSGTLTNANSVVLALYTNTAGANDAITHNASPWVTTADLPDEDLHMALGADHKTVSATTAVPATFGLASSTNWITLITAFKISAAAATTNNRGKDATRQLLEGSLPHLRMSPRSEREAKTFLRAQKRAYGFASASI